jgi:hypothetical protein
MVVARKRRKQTNHRTLDCSGADAVKPREGTVVEFEDMNQSSGGNAGRTIAGRGPLRPLEVDEISFSMRIAALRSGVSRIKGRRRLEKWSIQLLPWAVVAR